MSYLAPNTRARAGCFDSRNFSVYSRIIRGHWRSPASYSPEAQAHISAWRKWRNALDAIEERQSAEIRQAVRDVVKRLKRECRWTS